MAGFTEHEWDRRDLVLVFYLQVPQEDRQPILSATATAVARGGTLLLVAHDKRNLEQGHGGPKDASVLYTRQDVVRDLEGSGLQIERAAVVERPVDTPEGQRIALDALVRARTALIARLANQDRAARARRSFDGFAAPWPWISGADDATKRH
jgi:hypothetical protein